MLLFKRKDRVLIFGASSGGIAFYKKHIHLYKIVGFLDNNIQKQGRKLYSTKVFSPKDIKWLDFDRIIISSDYHAEIYIQLTKQYGIDESRIEVFSSEGGGESPWLQKLKKELEQHLHEITCNGVRLISKMAFYFLYRIWQQTDNIRSMPFEWLDRRDDLCVHIFRESMNSVSVGPKYIDGTQNVSDIILPRVALYHISNGQICSISRTILLSDDSALIERVETTDDGYMDYSGGHLIFHAKNTAIVRKDKAQSIEKGILISGASETNYYHWMLEVLSQLQFVTEIPEKYDDYPIIISLYSQKIPAVKAFIELANLRREFIFIESTSCYLVRDLLVITLPNNSVPNLKRTALTQVNYSYVRCDSLFFLKEIACRGISDVIRTAPHKRIFFARKGVIRNYNQEEIIKVVSAFHFHIVYMEDLDFQDQVTLMAHAEMIIGPSGAAWTNILFAPQKTKALCWMADKVGDASCFSNIAHAMDIEMDCIRYSVVASDTRDVYSASYYIEPEIVSRWIRNNVMTPIIS